MRKTGFNQADKTLLAAGIIFFIAFFLQLKFRGNIFFAGLFFCAEAALVGGIADWFAVTALFEKPLGFPYHTAILPRRREEFIAACIKMIQREFFGRKQLIMRLKDNAWRENIIGKLTTDDIVDGLKKQLWLQLREYLISKDWAPYKQLIKERFLGYVRKYEPAQLRELLISYLEQENKGKLLLIRLAEKLRPVVESEETAKKFEKMLADFQAERLRNPIMAFFASMAVSADMLNIREAAKLMQQRILEVLAEVAEPDSMLQNQVTDTVREKLTVLTESAEFQTSFDELRDKLLTACEIEENINRAIDVFLEDIKIDTSISELQIIFDRIIADELSRFIEKVRSEKYFQEETKELLYDIAARSALQAQAAIGTVVRNALAKMSEEQLNRIVRDKVEPDLIWIRINGSVVGAIIGLGLFTALTVVGTVMG